MGLPVHRLASFHERFDEKYKAPYTQLYPRVLDFAYSRLSSDLCLRYRRCSCRLILYSPCSCMVSYDTPKPWLSSPGVPALMVFPLLALHFLESPSDIPLHDPSRPSGYNFLRWAERTYRSFRLASAMCQKFVLLNAEYNPSTFQ